MSLAELMMNFPIILAFLVTIYSIIVSFVLVHLLQVKNAQRLLEWMVGSKWEVVIQKKRTSRR
jgi:hypothetical protein